MAYKHRNHMGYWEMSGNMVKTERRRNLISKQESTTTHERQGEATVSLREGRCNIRGRSSFKKGAQATVIVENE